MNGAKKFSWYPESSSHSGMVRGWTADNQARKTKLVDFARRLIRTRTRLGEYFPQGLIKDWAWDMLLELFVNHEEGDMVYVKQLILAAGISPPAAMRLIDRLQEAELIERIGDPMDSRRVIVTLSHRGQQAMVTLLESMFEPREDTAPKGPRSIPG